MKELSTDIPKEPKRENVHKMFDRIANRYDLLNRLLSFRQDVAWRNKVVSLLPKKENLSVLDLATGTGDLLLSMAEKSDNLTNGVGLDMSSGMLKYAVIKAKEQKSPKKLSFIRGDAVHIPFADHSFDVVSIAFGIRNVVDVQESLNEMNRVLDKNGKALILEFSLPQNKIVKVGYLFYFRYILPIVGGLISGDSYAYTYLNKTVETFPYGKDFCDLMEKAGFTTVSEHRLTFGIATIYEGVKN